MNYIVTPFSDFLTSFFEFVQTCLQRQVASCNDIPASGCEISEKQRSGIFLHCKHCFSQRETQATQKGMGNKCQQENHPVFCFSRKLGSAPFVAHFAWDNPVLNAFSGCRRGSRIKGLGWKCWDCNIFVGLPLSSFSLFSQQECSLTALNTKSSPSSSRSTHLPLISWCQEELWSTIRFLHRLVQHWSALIFGNNAGFPNSKAAREVRKKNVPERI